MERGVKKYDRLVSPESAKVWTEKSPKYRYNDAMRNDFAKNCSYSIVNGKRSNQCEEQELAVVEHGPRRVVAVVYYLCRNRQLEQPHFIEVSMSSADGLYLRDVTERLNVLRGRRMASMYSWSCKRSYKNGYVWHDLSEDDLILPAHGNEYVLKGSELFEESTSSDGFYPLGNVRLQTPRALPGIPSSRNRDDSSSPSSFNGRKMKHHEEDEASPSTERPVSLSVSKESSDEKNSSENGSLNLTNYKIYKSDGLADASTQTDEDLSRNTRVHESCISTNGSSFEGGKSRIEERKVSGVNEASVTCRDSVAPPSSYCAPSDGMNDTLESLIRADASKLNRLRMLKGKGYLAPTNSKVKASNVLIQLISCGTISVKEGSLGIIPSCKPNFLQSKFPSILFSTSSTLGEFDLPDNPRFMSLKLKDKDYFSGSLVERSMPPKEGASALKRSSSYNADRGTKDFDHVKTREETTNNMPSECIPHAIKASLLKQPRSESLRSPLSDGPRISSDRMDSSRNIATSSSRGGSKRFAEPTSTKNQQSRKSDSSRNQKENVIKIEES